MSKSKEEEILEDVTKIIDKRIPKKPDIYGNGYDNNGEIIYDTYDCPNCHKSYDVDYDGHGQYNYCPRCGQAIDWSD